VCRKLVILKRQGITRVEIPSFPLCISLISSSDGRSEVELDTSRTPIARSHLGDRCDGKGKAGLCGINECSKRERVSFGCQEDWKKEIKD
jgi:hypothetical protein